jgi:hypothetical protein
LDIRELRDWEKEAELKRTLDRGERYAASLLPHRRSEDVNREITKLEMEVYNLEHEEEVDRVEKMARKRLEEIRKKKARRRK